MIAFSETTIAAIATPVGTGGVAIIRLSGPDSWRIAEALCPSELSLKAGQICHRWLLEPDTGTPLDEVLILPFKAPKSFTGEDVIEIHTHGGLTLSQRVLQHCLALGAQPATAGEFSKRAVLNGRIDLTQAESILDLIHADGDALLQAAARNLKDATHAAWIHETLATLQTVQADMVASIDFPDEVDEPERTTLIASLQALGTMLELRRAQNTQREVLRDGFRVALLGQPNAGKSSLFNALLDENRAIVTDIAGTTRDTLQERLRLNGVPVTIIDTAGLRDKTEDVIEEIGIQRSLEAANHAHCVLYLCDGRVSDKETQRIDEALWAKIQTHKTPHLGGNIIIITKSDAADYTIPQWVQEKSNNVVSCPSLSVSSQTRDGLPELLETLSRHLATVANPEAVDLILSDREQQLLEAVLENVQMTIETLRQETLPLDLATVPMTDALRALQTMLGRDTTELVLDSVFSRFCVGK